MIDHFSYFTNGSLDRRLQIVDDYESYQDAFSLELNEGAQTAQKLKGNDYVDDQDELNLDSSDVDIEIVHCKEYSWNTDESEMDEE